mmetsp:Transcript_60813/g.162658  ORF Transcript_60813/g.162658 Transcript_60813/m.162658 type:complete len:633 (-) Transcript_60813:238-2136(-)
MKIIDHPHCVKLHNVFYTSTQIYLVLELMTGGELFDRIISKECYSEAEAANCFIQFMSAIEYLHSMGIVHRDIKPENILYATPAEDSPVKIGDFGFGKIVNFEGEVMSTMCGSPTFVAPEVIISKVRQGTNTSYDKLCDVWSAGVLLYCMLSGEHPFDQDSGVAELFRQITVGDYFFRPEIWDEISTEAKDLVRRMMTVDPKRRISAAECLAHPWCAAQREGKVSSKALTQAQLKLRDRHEALARKKLLGHAASLAAPGAGGSVGCLLARGQQLEIISINQWGKQLLACPSDPDPAPRYVRDVLDKSFIGTHERFMAKVFGDRSLPKSIQHPLRSVAMFRKDGTTIQCELLVGKLDETQDFDEEQAVFFGYFVPTAQSATGGRAGQTLQEKMRAAYGEGYAARLLSGEARPPPEHYDEITVASFTLPERLFDKASVGAVALRYRIHTLRLENGQIVALAGTNHVAHDLAFDQAERIIGFVTEMVAALGEHHFAIGIATGSASLSVEVLQTASRSPDAANFRYRPGGPAVEAALELERTGRPGVMHLTMSAADRLGSERGLFLDLSGAAAGPISLRSGNSPNQGGPRPNTPTQGGATSTRRNSATSSLLRQRSVWIDCFRPDQLVLREEHEEA